MDNPEALVESGAVKPEVLLSLGRELHATANTQLRKGYDSDWDGGVDDLIIGDMCLSKKQDGSITIEREYREYDKFVEVVVGVRNDGAINSASMTRYDFKGNETRKDMLREPHLLPAFLSTITDDIIKEVQLAEDANGSVLGT